jgi:type II secretory pathway component GspD/PulD (secretin)
VSSSSPASAAPGRPAGPAGAAPPAAPPTSTLHQVRYEAAAPPLTKGPATGPDTITAPRGPVQAEALPELGVIIVRGQNPADVAAVMKIIEYIRRIQATGDLKIEMVYLEHADATAVTNHLTELYRRVVVGPAGTTRATTTQRSTTTPQGQRVTEEQLASVVLLPYPRFNSILVAAPRVRFEEILKQIKEHDKPNPPISQAVPFPLQRAGASRVAGQIQAWYAQRYPNETAAQHQIRFTADDTSNTVFVQASPADLADIRVLIEWYDSKESGAINNLRIQPLRYALADELSQLLLRAIQQGIVPTTTGGTGIVPTPGAPGALPGALPGAQPGALPGALPGAPGARPGALPGAPALPGQAGVPGGTLATKTVSLRFVSTTKDASRTFESGFLDDIRLTPDVRINSIILSAPPKTMDLLLALIKELDVPPAARAEIKVFPLQKGDAATMAATIQQLFFGVSTGLPTGPGAPGAPGLPGAPGAPGAPTPTPGAFPGAAGIPGGVRPPQFTVAGTTAEGAPLIELRITVDQRTNSVIVAGSESDLLVVEAMISRLEESEAPARQNEVYHLRNAPAVDVANALNLFLQNSLTVLARGGQLTAFQDIQREVVVVPEAITNKLLISATPRYFPDIMRLIHELDAELPQVVIQVLLAEIDLSNTEEFGVEIGLQSPVLFQRSIIPATDLFGTAGSASYANTTNTSPVGFPVAPGVTVSSTINPAANPGFNFSNPAIALGNNPVVNPGVVGVQGLGSLGVGRISPTSGIGGFVFSAASDSFSLLIRALKMQGRVDVLSRPQVMTLDNQAAQVAIGQSVPYTTGTATAAATTTTAVSYRDVGVILNVIPKISPDGKVIMRVTPQVSSVSPQMLNLGNGFMAPVFNQQVIDTTVTAQDGETVAIGGLITRSDSKTENKIPWFGDLPYVGALFRYRTQTKRKVELLVIMTPHIVRNRMEADRILAMEGKRMDWILGDVVKTQGDSGMYPLFTPEPHGHNGGAVDGALPAPLTPVLPGVPASPVVPAMPPAPETLPAPRPLPPAGMGAAPAPAGPALATAEPRPLQGLSTLPGRGTVGPISQPVVTPVGPAPSAGPATAPADTKPAEQGKESDRWRLFRRGS